MRAEAKAHSSPKVSTLRQRRNRLSSSAWPVVRRRRERRTRPRPTTARPKARSAGGGPRPVLRFRLATSLASDPSRVLASIVGSPPTPDYRDAGPTHPERAGPGGEGGNSRFGNAGAGSRRGGGQAGRGAGRRRSDQATASFSPTPSGGRSGSRIVNVVPLFTWLSTSMRPP